MRLENLNTILKNFIVCIVLCMVSGASFGQLKEQEADLKAAFIYNFTKYIDWDTTTDQTDFVIGIVGQSPVTQSLYEIAKSSKVGNKKIIIKTFSRPEDISYCQVLFIPRDLRFSLESILDKIDKNVLTVSEEPGYAKQGTSFNFFITKDKLKFEANLKAINAAGLKAGSQLLKLATIVD